jgi:hypothetical protein
MRLVSSLESEKFGPRVQPASLGPAACDTRSASWTSAVGIAVGAAHMHLPAKASRHG